MADLRSFPVFDANGQIGRVLTTARFLDDRAEKTVLLDNGQELKVPAGALEVRKDGSFFLRDSANFLPSPQAHPAEPEIQTAAPAPVASNGNAPIPWPEPAVKPQIPAEALFKSGYDIQTVNVDKLLDGPAQERQEGDTLILPVVEEVWVMEKKLYLRQEIRITKRQSAVGQAQIIERSRIS